MPLGGWLGQLLQRPRETSPLRPLLGAGAGRACGRQELRVQKGKPAETKVIVCMAGGERKNLFLHLHLHY